MPRCNDPEPKDLREAAVWYDGMEVHKDNWPEAEEIVKSSPDMFSFDGPARGPDRAWKRLEYLGGEE